jgi:outer membrane protein assembly factor BamB
MSAFVDMNGDGMVSWSIPVNLNIFGGTTIVGDTGYFGSFNGKLYAVDLKEKKIKWTYQTDTSKENYSKVFDETDQVKADLAEKMNYNYKDIYDLYQSLGSILSTPAVSDGVVYFGSTDGYLYALQ